MKYLSNELLEKLYQESEANLELAINQWQKLPAVRLLKEPASGAWSAAQCLSHLNSYGNYYLPAIEKSITLCEDKPTAFFKSGLLGNYFYKLMLPEINGRPRKKMKSPKNHVPLSTVNASAVLAEFIGQQELLGQLIIKARQVDINKAKTGISIAPFIKLKLGDTLLFFTAHINRHMRQAERALDAYH